MMIKTKAITIEPFDLELNFFQPPDSFEDNLFIAKHFHAGELRIHMTLRLFAK